eukprot:12884061-Prorocentrum_lima.AAC.1
MQHVWDSGPRSHDPLVHATRQELRLEVDQLLVFVKRYLVSHMRRNIRRRVPLKGHWWRAGIPRPCEQCTNLLFLGVR